MSNLAFGIFLVISVGLYLGFRAREFVYAKKLGAMLLVVKITLVLFIVENALLHLLMKPIGLIWVFLIELAAFFVNITLARLIFQFSNSDSRKKK